MNAAPDSDVAIVRNYIDHWVNFGHAEARRALERIECRLRGDQPEEWEKRLISAANDPADERVQWLDERAES